MSQKQREKLLSDLHVSYIKSLDEKTETLEYSMTEHLRISGAYWGLTAMALMKKLSEMDSNKAENWVLKCQHPCGLPDIALMFVDGSRNWKSFSGGFGGNENHDPHILYTLSAVQILALFDKLDLVDADKIAAYISSLQQEDGSFAGDIWGEIDTRFSYCAISCLSLLNRLDKINLDLAVEYIAKCRNFDGGFGATPGGESHAGQIFCCVGALAIAKCLHLVDRDLLGWWLAERQVAGGGLNGRPEKKPDVCYSWWVLSSLTLLDRVHWINGEKLKEFILDCQDEERGGISDRPDDMVDVFHTFFGIGGLSLLDYPGLERIDPAYALPVDVVNRVLAKHV